VFQLVSELRRIAARADSIVISTNVPVRVSDGLPYASASRRQTSPEDPGVAVYWRNRSDHPVAMACDRYDAVLGNLRGVALTLEAFRAIARHGSSELLERAFAGFVAIPEKTGVERWTVFDLEVPPPTLAQALSAYRKKVLESGPTVALNTARAAAQVHYAATGKES